MTNASKPELEAKHKWFALFLMVMCPFINALNGSIVSNALPTMSTELGVSTGNINWVISAFLIVTSATILIFGRIGDLIGNVRVLQTGMLVFTIGTIMCGFSHNFMFLIISRIIQALGAGAVYANNHGIITRMFSKSERGKALGINAAFVALGNLTGPALGGFILSFASWNMIFFILAPVAGCLAVLQFLFLPKDDRTPAEKFDYAGSLLFISAIASMFFALQEIQSRGITDPMIVISFSVCVLSFAAFFVRSVKCKYSVIDLSLFKNAVFDINLYCAFTSYISIQAYTVIMPFYFQDVLKMSSAQSGLYMTIYPIVLACIAPLSGTISDKIGTDKITIAGMVILMTGMFLVSSLNESSSHFEIIIYLITMGVGNGMFQSPNNSLIMSSVPSNKVGIAGSLNALIRNIGQNTGVVIATLLLYMGISAKLGYSVNDYDGAHPEAFEYGMKITFVSLALIVFTGAVISVYRYYIINKHIKSLKLSDNSSCK